MTDPRRFVPLFPSEQLLRGVGGQPPFKGCGISTDHICTSWATLGESTLLPNGRLKGKAALKADLTRGWRAFTRVADSNGIPDTGDLTRIHRAMFPGLPDPRQLFTRDFGEVTDALDSGFAVSIAVRLAALPASSPLREYTSADHQIPLVGRDGGKSRRQDPMHAHSATYPGEMVPLDDVRTAARAIENGLILAWTYPIGKWTAAALQTAGLRDKLREEWAMLVKLEARIAAQLARIAELEAGSPIDCSNAVAAEHERTLVAAIAHLERMRTE